MFSCPLEQREPRRLSMLTARDPPKKERMSRFAACRVSTTGRPCFLQIPLVMSTTDILTAPGGPPERSEAPFGRGTKLAELSGEGKVLQQADEEAGPKGPSGIETLFAGRDQNVFAIIDISSYGEFGVRLCQKDETTGSERLKIVIKTMDSDAESCKAHEFKTHVWAQISVDTIF